MTEKELIAAIDGHNIKGLKVDEKLTVAQLKLILDGIESSSKISELEKALELAKSDENLKALTDANEQLSKKSGRA